MTNEANDQCNERHFWDEPIPSFKGRTLLPHGDFCKTTQEVQNKEQKTRFRAITQSHHGSESVRGHGQTMRPMRPAKVRRECQEVSPTENREEGREARRLSLWVSKGTLNWCQAMRSNTDIGFGIAACLPRRRAPCRRSPAGSNMERNKASCIFRANTITCTAKWKTITYKIAAASERMPRMLDGSIRCFRYSGKWPGHMQL